MGKDTNKTIYLVTQGEYSDYRIVGAYSTKKKAQEYVDRHTASENYNNPEIEEYDLDPIDTTVPYICIHLKSNGDIAYSLDSIQVYFEEPNSRSDQIHDVKFYASNHYQYYTWVQTDDKTRAVKVANERLMQYKAENNL